MKFCLFVCLRLWHKSNEPSMPVQRKVKGDTRKLVNTFVKNEKKDIFQRMLNYMLGTLSPFVVLDSQGASETRLHFTYYHLYLNSTMDIFLT